MASITILNLSSRPIEFFLYYLTKSCPETISTKNTAFFGPGMYKTMNYPDDCNDILISIRMQSSPKILEHIASLKLISPVTKIYQFVCKSIKEGSLFEVDPTTFKNKRTFNLKNRTLYGAAIKLDFDIGGNHFNQSESIAKNRAVTCIIPFNSKTLSFTAYIYNTSQSWIAFETINLQNITQNKCFELSLNNPNSTTKFLLTEIKCITKS